MDFQVIIVRCLHARLHCANLEVFLPWNFFVHGDQIYLIFIVVPILTEYIFCWHIGMWCLCLDFVVTCMVFGTLFTSLRFKSGQMLCSQTYLSSFNVFAC